MEELFERLIDEELGGSYNSSPLVTSIEEVRDECLEILERATSDAFSEGYHRGRNDHQKRQH